MPRSAAAFWALGLALGTPRPQNKAGHLLGHGGAPALRVLHACADTALPRTCAYARCAQACEGHRRRCVAPGDAAVHHLRRAAVSHRLGGHRAFAASAHAFARLLLTRRVFGGRWGCCAWRRRARAATRRWSPPPPFTTRRAQRGVPVQFTCSQHTTHAAPRRAAAAHAAGAGGGAGAAVCMGPQGRGARGRRPLVLRPCLLPPGRPRGVHVRPLLHRRGAGDPEASGIPADRPAPARGSPACAPAPPKAPSAPAPAPTGRASPTPASR